MENLKPQIIEDFTETVKGPDMKELLILKTEMYANSTKTRLNKQMSNWYRLASIIDPGCQKTRLHQFLIGSSTPTGACEIDDLEGDLSAEAFLRANDDERDQIIQRLQESLKSAEKK